MNYTVQTGSVDQQIPAPVGFWKAFRFWLKLGFISFGGPLISSRRRATRSVPVGGRAINAEETLSLFWVSANRDEQVFEDAELFRGPRSEQKPFVWGGYTCVSRSTIGATCISRPHGRGAGGDERHNAHWCLANASSFSRRWLQSTQYSVPITDASGFAP